MRDIKPTHKPIKNFYAELKQYEELGATNETEVRLAFATLLQYYARQNNLTLICEKSLRTPQNTTIYTEKIFSTVFDNRDFTRRNIIAREIGNVIDTLTERSYNRAEFLRELSPFYGAIQGAAATFIDFSQKQHFLNTVYEQFFQRINLLLDPTFLLEYK